MNEPITWTDAPELFDLALPIIKQHHGHLVDAPLRFVWRSPARKRGRMTIFGTAEVVSGRFAAYVMTEEENASADELGVSGTMFWIEIARNEWQSLSDLQRLALLDHELCHCVIEETDRGPRLALDEHDFEEFERIVERHGPWTPALERIAATLTGMDGVRA